MIISKALFKLCIFKYLVLNKCVAYIFILIQGLIDVKKSSYAGIGLGIAVTVIIAIFFGISYPNLAANPSDGPESVGTNDSVTVKIEQAPENQGKELQVNVSDGIASHEGP